MTEQHRRSGDAPGRPRAPKGAASDEERRLADSSDVARPVEENRDEQNADEERPHHLDDEAEDSDLEELEDEDLVEENER
ncbi:MAG: hypothetical protein M3R62_08550 [Acidobacteriota bacterium]|nr:hypothetical protein [Acidobacteriota bacterium]